MKYVITENQHNLLKEYFDPIYFLKKKMSKEPRQIKPEQNIKYEEDFQKYVNIIFKLTYKLNPLEHLKGFDLYVNLKIKFTYFWKSSSYLILCSGFI